MAYQIGKYSTPYVATCHVIHRGKGNVVFIDICIEQPTLLIYQAFELT